MTPYARPVVDDVHGRLVHLLVEPQDLDRHPAACGASPWPGRWITYADDRKTWCKTCVSKIRDKR